MSYRISYTSAEGEKNHSGKNHNFGAILLVFAVFCVCVHFFWPEGRLAFWEIILPGKGEAAVMAADLFFVSVRNGLPVSRSFSVFCRQLLFGGTV